ncbi:MAG TPA: hypothetical protein VKF59_20270 [Candidatus Dormibacteraeota bacterium]|nr:hypothetical protein [Candidatus Dormibacteraeota bacterium]
MTLHCLSEPPPAEPDRARRRHARLAPWAGGVVVVLAIAAAAGPLMLTRLHGASPARPRPNAATPAQAKPARTPAASPTAVATAFSSPDSVAAIVFHDPVDRTRLDAVTWDGSGLGRLSAAGEPNPAGTLFLTASAVVDRQGTTVATLTPSGKDLPTWADDGRSLCRITPPTGSATGAPASLQVAPLGGAWRTVGQFGTVGPNTGVSVVACSTLNDRAVLVPRNYQGPSALGVLVVQLSTGHVLWSRSYTPPETGFVDIAASRDGAYVAEGRLTPGTGTTTTVYGPRGTVAGTFDGHAGGYAATAFSWDGSRLVLAAGADESRVTVVDVGTGATVWRAPDGLEVAAVLVEPAGGGRLGIALNGSGAFAGPDGYVAAADLYLVDAGGVAQRVDTQIRP